MCMYVGNVIIMYVCTILCMYHHVCMSIYCMYVANMYVCMYLCLVSYVFIYVCMY
jgi:hypothetical protein